LGRLGDPQAVPVLLELLRGGKEDVRYAAAIALGRLRDARATAPLQKVSQSDPQNFVRDAASRALKELSR